MLEHKESRESYEEDSSKRLTLKLIQCDAESSPKREVWIEMRKTIDDEDYVEQQSFESYQKSIQHEFSKQVLDQEFKWSAKFEQSFD